MIKENSNVLKIILSGFVLLIVGLVVFIKFILLATSFEVSKNSFINNITSIGFIAIFLFLTTWLIFYISNCIYKKLSYMYKKLNPSKHFLSIFIFFIFAPVLLVLFINSFIYEKTYNLYIRKNTLYQIFLLNPIVFLLTFIFIVLICNLISNLFVNYDFFFLIEYIHELYMFLLTKVCGVYIP